MIANNLKILNEDDLPVLKRAFHTELINILEWWSCNMVDEQNGGFFGRIDGNDVLHPSIG